MIAARIIRLRFLMVQIEKRSKVKQITYQMNLCSSLNNLQNGGFNLWLIKILIIMENKP